MPDVQLQQEQNLVRLPAYSHEPIRAQNTGGISAFFTDQMLHNCSAYKDDKVGEFTVQKRPGIQINSPDFSSYLSSTTCAKDHISISQTSDINVVAIHDFLASKIMIFSVEGASNLVIKIGEIASSSIGDWCHLTELNVGGLPYLGVVWTQFDRSTSKGFYAASTSGVFTAASLTEITAGVDPDFPAVIAGKVITGPFVQLDQTIYIMTTDGGIYNSGTGVSPDDITAWNALGVTAAQAYPDKGVGLCRYKNHLLAFGEDSLEFFNDAGNPFPKSPLQRTDQAFIKFGAADSKLIKTINDQVFWVAVGSSSTDGLWTLDQYTPKKLSNARKDMEISTAYSADNGSYHMHLRNIVMNGENHLIITSAYNNRDGAFYYYGPSYDAADPSGGSSYSLAGNMICYNIDSATWWYCTDMNSQTTGSLYWLPAGYQPIAGGLDQNKYLQFIVKGSTGASGSQDSSYIYSVEGTDTWEFFYDSNYTGSNLTGVFANAVRATIQFPSFEFYNLKRKFIHRIELVMDMIGTKLGVTPTPASRIYVVLVRNDFAGPESTEGATNLARNRFITCPNAKYRYYLNNWGAMRRGTIAISNCSPSSWRVRGLELTVSQGVS